MWRSQVLCALLLHSRQGRPGLCSGPAGDKSPDPIYLFRTWHQLPAGGPDQRFSEIGTEHSRRAALTQAAARRWGSRGQSPRSAKPLNSSQRYRLSHLPP